MLALKFLFTLLAAIAIVFLLVINGHNVDIHYYNLHFEFKTLSISLSIVLITLTLTGFFTAWILGLIEQFKLNRLVRKQNKRIRDMEKELESIAQSREIPRAYSEINSDSGSESENDGENESSQIIAQSNEEEEETTEDTEKKCSDDTETDKVKDTAGIKPSTEIVASPS